MDKSPLEQSQFAGAAGLAMLISLFLPWITLGGMGGMSMANFISMGLRYGGVGEIFSEAPLLALDFLAAIVLAAYVAWRGLLQKSCGKLSAVLAGAAGLVIPVITLIDASDEPASPFGSALDLIGVGAYLFIAGAILLTYLGIFGKAKIATA